MHEAKRRGRAGVWHWVRFAAARGLRTGDFRVFEPETRFFAGFDWVRFAPHDAMAYSRARPNALLASFRTFAMRLKMTEEN